MPFDDDEADDALPGPIGPRGGPSRDRRDKVPALILAARRARDDHTKLLLLQKARQIDPGNADLCLLRAAIFARRGDDEAERAEYRAALEADPTHWLARYQLLNLEFPLERNLSHACGIVRDLAWERGITERVLNAGRGSYRNESELSHDEAVLGHLALAGAGGGHGVVALERVALERGGGVLVLNTLEPWLERFDADGSLVYGTDLWIADEDEPVQDAADVALCADGSALVCEPRAGRVRRLEPDGTWARRGLAGALIVRPIAVAVAAREGGRGKAGEEALVLCGETRRAVRVPVDGGRLRAAYSIPGRGPPRSASVALAPDGTGYALVDGRVHVLPPRGDRPSAGFPARGASGPGGTGRARAKGEAMGTAKDAARRGAASKGEPVAPAAGSAAGRPFGEGGIAFDPSDGTLLVADAARDEVVRLDRAGRFLERIGEPGSFRRPADVAADGRGRIVVADTGRARVIVRERSGGDWMVLFGGSGLTAPPRRRGAAGGGGP
jgi:hypothetical protein